MKIRAIEDAFDQLEVITEGTYGIVFKATDRFTGETKAIKKYKPISTLTDNGLCVTLVREIALLKGLRHPRLIEFERVLLDDCRHVYCVMAYYPSNLKKLTFPSLKTKMAKVRSIVRQVLDAVAYIHSQSVVHRDLNPNNILIDDQLNVRICDFGLARLVFPGTTKDLTSEIVTLNYRAPEILLGEAGYTHKIDLWAVGCVFYELVTGKQLFRSSEERGLLIDICQTLGTPNDLTWPAFTSYTTRLGITVPKFEESPSFKLDLVNGGLSRAGVDFARKLLLFDSNRRMDAPGALAHPFLCEEDGEEQPYAFRS